MIVRLCLVGLLLYLLLLLVSWHRRKTLSPWSHTRNRMQTPKIMMGGCSSSVRSRIITSPCHPDRLWGSPSLLSNRYRGFFLLRKSRRVAKLTAHQLEPVRVRVTLRLTVSQSVSMSWCRAHFVDVWPDIASFSRVLVWNLLSCLSGAPSLTRGRVYPDVTKTWVYTSTTLYIFTA
jgi:hypothetical protein